MGQEERTRKEVPTLLSRAKAVLAAAFVAACMMVGMAVPAFAFIHDVTPVEGCANAASNENAGENTTAGGHLANQPGLNEDGSIQSPPAPDECPAPQK
jgi:hypothetical protein